MKRLKLQPTMSDAIAYFYKYHTKAENNGMVKVTDDVKWLSYGEMRKPTELERKKRAFAYALTVTALNDVGAGADENLAMVRSIQSQILMICLIETGYLISTYASSLVGSDYIGWNKNPFKKKVTK